MTFYKSDIVLISFPFTDLTDSKIRPALVITEKNDDLIVIGIFSKVPDLIEESWIVLGEESQWFTQTGLKKRSLIKTEKIAVIHKSRLIMCFGLLI